jgi:hypothetical protein
MFMAVPTIYSKLISECDLSRSRAKKDDSGLRQNEVHGFRVDGITYNDSRELRIVSGHKLLERYRTKEI